jgi:hypothetical protein
MSVIAHMELRTCCFRYRSVILACTEGSSVVRVPRDCCGGQNLWAILAAGAATYVRVIANLAHSLTGRASFLPFFTSRQQFASFASLAVVSVSLMRYVSQDLISLDVWRISRFPPRCPLRTRSRDLHDASPASPG